MTLRARALVASGVAVAVLALMALAVFVQFVVTAATNQALQDALSPASDASAALSLAQADASGALSDYIMLRRERSLTEYRTSIARADALIADLERIVPSDVDDLHAQLVRATTAQRTWVAVDAEPSLAALEADDSAEATRITNSRAAWSAYDEMTESSSDLARSVNDVRDAAAGALNAFTTFLGVTLLVVGVVVALGLLGFVLGLQRWVLVPLRRVRHDLQQAARVEGHDTPIRAVGPPELRDVATDGEQLRRDLVAEIDEARSAREGLLQDAPLVAAMQAELAPRDIDPPAGLAVWGTTQSAEGVVAGDWWDAVTRPDGSLAIVVADVSGHGPQASVMALRVRSILRAGLEGGISAAEVLSMAAVSCTQDQHFVTALIVVVDHTGDALTWANAGHHPAIVVTDGKDASTLDATGPLISSLGGTWSEQARRLQPGDVVVAFTDGLVESRDASGDEFDAARLTQSLRAMDGWVRHDPHELVTRILAQVRHRAADWRRDDVTLVALARVP